MSGDDDADQPAVPLVCPDCDTETRVALPDLADAIDRHNDQLHDGADVAQVDPDVAEQVQDLVAEDMGLTGE